MVEYNCECCQYTTNRKLNYDRHLLSVRHLEKAENPAPIEKNNDNNNDNNEINKLLEIIKMKDELIKKQEDEIKLLKEKLQPTPPPLFSGKIILKPKQENVTMEVKEIVKKDLEPKVASLEPKVASLEPKVASLETPNLNIEDFFNKYIKKGGETKYTFLHSVNGIDRPVIKFEYLKKGFMYKVKKVVQELTLNGLKELPEGICFYNVVNERLNRFKIKTNGQIITTKHNEKEVDKCLKSLLIKIFDFLRGSITSFVYSFSKQIELIDSDDNEIIAEARNKKLFGEILTSQEEALLKKDDKNLKVMNNFQKLTGVDYTSFHDNRYNTEIMQQFNEIDEKAELKHFKVLLARKAERIIEEDSSKESEESEESEQESVEEEE
jgi:hypothetical protein